MGTAGKLWLGFGLLLLLLIGIGLFVSHRLRLIDRALTTITAVREPASAATYEMEVTLLGSSTAVLDYVNTGDETRRREAGVGFAEFDRLLLEYDRIARSEPSRALGRRIAEAYVSFRALGDTLMTLSEEQRARYRAFGSSSASLRSLLERRLQADVEARGRDGEKKARETARLSAAISEIGAAVGFLSPGVGSSVLPRLEALEADFDGALARYRGLHLSDEEASAAAALERKFADYTSQARELTGLDESTRRSLARFLAQRGRVESLLDEGVQVLARIDLLLAQQSARRAVRTSLLAVLLLLAAGITIVSATALPAGRGIVRTERQLREQTEALAVAHRRKDEFLGVLGHELRNPLAPLSNSLHVLAGRRDELPDGVREAHATMQHQVRHMARLVDDLLDVSRISEGKIALRREPMDLGAAAARIAAGLRRSFEEQGLALRVLPPEAPVWVDADPVRVDQVVTNLLNNAAKYTPSGGRVELAVVAEDPHAVLRLRDTGVGIPAEMLDQVFEPFVQVDSTRTRRHGGLGIGLTLVRRLVEIHGGSVRAESPGAEMGSTFTVELPLVPAPLVPPAPREVAAFPAPGAPSRRVLVVDDSEAGAATMAELLRMWGHEVAIAPDGPAALRAVGEAHPQLVLLDIALPGMDGYEVATRLRRLPGGDRLRLIAITGFGQEADRRRAFAAGFDEHLTKPVSPSDLIDLLARAG